MGVGSGVSVAVAIGVGVGTGVAVGVKVGIAVGAGVGIRLLVCARVTVGAAVGPDVDEGTAVDVGTVAVGVGAGVDVGIVEQVARVREIKKKDKTRRKRMAEPPHKFGVAAFGSTGPGSPCLFNYESRPAHPEPAEGCNAVELGRRQGGYEFFVGWWSWRDSNPLPLQCH